MREIEIKRNGVPERIPEGLTVAELLARLKLQPDRVAVEKNGKIVPKAAYDRATLEADDCLEIVSFVGGG